MAKTQKGKKQARKKKAKKLTPFMNIKIIWLKVREIQVPGAKPTPQWVFFEGIDNDGKGNPVRGYFAYGVPTDFKKGEVELWTFKLVSALINDTRVNIAYVDNGTPISHDYEESYEVPNNTPYPVDPGDPQDHYLSKYVEPK